MYMHTIWWFIYHIIIENTKIFTYWCIFIYIYFVITRDTQTGNIFSWCICDRLSNEEIMTCHFITNYERCFFTSLLEVNHQSYTPNKRNEFFWMVLYSYSCTYGYFYFCSSTCFGKVTVLLLYCTKLYFYFSSVFGFPSHHWLIAFLSLCHWVLAYKLRSHPFPVITGY